MMHFQFNKHAKLFKITYCVREIVILIFQHKILHPLHYVLSALPLARLSIYNREFLLQANTKNTKKKISNIVLLTCVKHKWNLKQLRKMLTNPQVQQACNRRQNETLMPLKNPKWTPFHVWGKLWRAHSERCIMCKHVRLKQ